MKDHTTDAKARLFRDHWDSAALLTICLIDMLTTLYWVHTHQAFEANPIMAYFLSRGDLAFCAVKLATVLPFVALACYYRRRRPRLIAFSMRVTLALFIGIYVTCMATQAHWL